MKTKAAARGRHEVRARFCLLIYFLCLKTACQPGRARVEGKTQWFQRQRLSREPFYFCGGQGDREQKDWVFGMTGVLLGHKRKGAVTDRGEKGGFRGERRRQLLFSQWRGELVG